MIPTLYLVSIKESLFTMLLPSSKQLFLARKGRKKKERKKKRFLLNFVKCNLKLNIIKKNFLFNFFQLQKKNPS